MITGSILAFAPPKHAPRPEGGGKRSKGCKSSDQRTPFPAARKGKGRPIGRRAHRLLCWVLAVLATKLASASYALSRIGVLNQWQTCWLLRLASRLHAKSVGMLIGGSW